MNKIFLLAALSAATLSLGFTACSDEDDSELKHSETYSLHFYTEPDADTDLQTLVNAYCSATGLSTDDVLEFTVTKGDSTACANALLDMMEKAETALSAESNWQGESTVLVTDTRHNHIYTRCYGLNGDNSSAYITIRKFGVTYSGSVEKYVKDIYVDAFEKGWGKGFVASYYSSCDMNEAAGGRDVYIEYVTTDDASEAVTGAFVLNSSFGDVPETLIYQGVEYTRCSLKDSSTQPNHKGADLNSESGGRFLFIYTTHDRSLGKCLLSSGAYTVFKKKSKIFGADYYPTNLYEIEEGVAGLNEKYGVDFGLYNVYGDLVEFMPATYHIDTAEDLSNITLQHRDAPDELDYHYGQDMSEGAGGAYIYVIMQWEKQQESNYTE